MTMNPRLSLIAVLAAISMTAPGVALACELPQSIAGFRDARSLDASKIEKLQKGLRIRFADKEPVQSALLSDGRLGPFSVNLVYEICQADLKGYASDNLMKDAVTLALAYAELPEGAPDVAGLIIAPEFRADFAAVVLNGYAPKTAGLIAVLDDLGDTASDAFDPRSIRRRLADLPTFDVAKELRDAILETVIRSTDIIETGFFNAVASTTLNSAVMNAQVHFLDAKKVNELALSSVHEDKVFLAQFEGQEFRDKSEIADVLDKDYRANRRAKAESAADMIVEAMGNVPTAVDASLPNLSLDDGDQVTTSPMFTNTEATIEAIIEAIDDEGIRDALQNMNMNVSASGGNLKAKVMMVLTEAIDRQAEDYVDRKGGEIVGLIQTRYRLADADIDALTRVATTPPAPIGPTATSARDQSAAVLTDQAGLSETRLSTEDKIALIEDMIHLKISAEDAVERHGLPSDEVDLWLVAASAGAEKARDEQQVVNRLTDKRLRQAHEAYGEAVLELRRFGKTPSSPASEPAE